MRLAKHTLSVGALICVLSGCTMPVDDTAEPRLGEVSQAYSGGKFYPLTLVHPPDADGVNVCFTNPANEYVTERGWVHDVMVQTFPTYSNIRFNGFGICPNTTSRGIHVTISATGGSASVCALDCVAVSVFAALPAAPECQGTYREHCVKTVTVHEVGHALGADDEYKHPLIPPSCSNVHADPSTRYWVGAGPDYTSIMYGLANCSQTTHRNWKLTPFDIRTIQMVYGTPWDRIGVSWHDWYGGVHPWTIDIDGTQHYEGGEDNIIGSLGTWYTLPVSGVFSYNSTDYIDRIGTFDQSSAYWWLDYNGNGAVDGGDRYGYFGTTDDIPVPGRYTSGVSLIAVYRPSDGYFYIDMNNNMTWDGADFYARFLAPQAGDYPIVGDWTGTGRERVGIYRNGYAYLDYNGDYVWSQGDTYWHFVPVDPWGYSVTTGYPLFANFLGTGNRFAIYSGGYLYIDANNNHVWDANDKTIDVGIVGTPIAGRLPRISPVPVGSHPMWCAGIGCSPTCYDGVRNAGETDVDCGGSTTCNRCYTNKLCSAGSDCQSNVCTGGRCALY